jgi:hypothetical protein
MALAVLEHWFMVLPLPSEALWRWWGLRPPRPAWAAAVDRSAAVPYDVDHGPARASAASLLTMEALRPRGAPLHTTSAAPGRTEAT